jgi:bisanhydrobacterioruberin hydratase
MGDEQWTANSLRKNRVLLGIIVLFHAIGFAGLQTAARETFLGLSSLNLLLAMVCLLLSFQPRKIANLLFDVVLVGMVGFIAELIGVHTGWLFGQYSYSDTLGWKLWDVPLIIAVNWAMLSFASVACVIRLPIPIALKAMFSAALMTGLDYLIEPVALDCHFWTWERTGIPVFNYLSWFAVSFPLHLYLLYRKTPQQNLVSVGLFVVLLVFFGLLNWI